MEYIKAKEEFHKFVNEEISEDKAGRIKETVAGLLPLWAMLISNQELG